MCTSNPNRIPLILSAAMRFKPRSILDVGIGFGKFGILFREYLDCWHRPDRERYLKSHWSLKLVGVEVFEPFIQDHQRFIYDTILIGDIRELVANGRLAEEGTLDLGVLSDVIEHMPKEDGLTLIEGLRKQCQHLIITTPNGFTKQGPIMGNRAEAHHCGWTPEEFVALGFRTTAAKDYCCAVL